MSTQLATDKSTTFIGGQDASKTPHLVPEDAYYAGVNVSVEKGILKPRWGLEKLSKKLIFPTTGVAQANTLIKSFKDIFHTGKYQALTSYSVGPDYFIVVVISGQIFFINTESLQVQNIPLVGEPINPRADRINWSPAGKYLVLFDFPAYPVIIEGITARRADPAKLEIPVSNIGGYNQNRLIVGNAGNEFTAGDPAGSTAAPFAPITFQEFFLPNTGFTNQVFQLSTNYNNDPITAIGFLQVSDTSTGIGPLLVATKQAIYSYQTQLPRAQWVAGQFGSVLVYNAGIVGPRAIENINSDVMFFSPDGQARSLSMSRTEQGRWSKTPISKEVINWLVVNDPNLLKYSFITYFKNKVFFAANPIRVSSLGINNEPLPDYAFGGLAVLELDNISTLTKEDAPAWAGLWTGVRPMDMVTINERCYIISKDGLTNELYQFRPDISHDLEGSTIRKVRSRVYTREYDFGDSDFNTKFLQSVDLKLKQLKGDFEVKVRYRPDHQENYFDWGSFKHTAPWRNCRFPFFFNGLAPQSFMGINLGSPKGATTSCNPVARLQNQAFRHVQLELTFEGIYWELEGLRIKANLDQQSENINSCPSYPTIAVPAECTDDWSYKGFEICQKLT